MKYTYDAIQDEGNEIDGYYPKIKDSINTDTVEEFWEFEEYWTREGCRIACGNAPQN
jgi:hypothetical protein